jgi:hypothetical protein
VDTHLCIHIVVKKPAFSSMSAKSRVEQFGGKVREFKALFNNTLDPERAAELRYKIRPAGIPL